VRGLQDERRLGFEFKGIASTARRWSFFCKLQLTVTKTAEPEARERERAPCGVKKSESVGGGTSSAFGGGGWTGIRGSELASLETLKPEHVQGPRARGEGEAAERKGEKQKAILEGPDGQSARAREEWRRVCGK